MEPMAANRLEDDLHPIGRIYYAASTLVCVPTSLAQEVGAALGAQAAEGQTARCHHGGRFRQRPARGRNTFQHGAGSACLKQSTPRAAPPELDILDRARLDSSAGEER